MNACVCKWCAFAGQDYYEVFGAKEQVWAGDFLELGMADIECIY